MTAFIIVSVSYSPESLLLSELELSTASPEYFAKENSLCWHNIKRFNEIFRNLQERLDAEM